VAALGHGRAVAHETAFIDSLRALATHSGARGLLDDAAVLEVGGTRLVLSHDMLVEGVHFLPSDPPESVAWKLVAVNLSDLAGKGATPLAALMGYTLTGDAEWDAAFVAGLQVALTTFNLPLIGGDTVSGKERALGLTVIGTGGAVIPARAGAGVGDGIYVTGTLGDAGYGLGMAKRGDYEPRSLLDAYRKPVPQIAAGALLAPVVTAMMDVSDGLLIDAARMAEASGVAAMIDLDAVPLSSAYQSAVGNNRDTRLSAVTAGDDYQLLFTSTLPFPALPCAVTRIGQMVRGNGVHLYDANGGVPLPERLGWLHGG
jgi:thiamine-monophosphate kinase